MLSLIEIAGRLNAVRWNGTESFQAQCPCHDDSKPSLTVSNGNNGGIVVHCHAGCETKDILRAIGITFEDISPSKVAAKAGNGFDWGNIVAIYEYENGTRKLRDLHKNFLWQHKENEQWKSGRGDAPHVLFKAGEPADTVFVVEGEKDANNLAQHLGVFAVSAENGASKVASSGKWNPAYTKELAGKNVILLPDNDAIGRAFMNEAANALSGVVATIKLLDLRAIYPECPEKGDISDFLNRYDDAVAHEKLIALVEHTDAWKPDVQALGGKDIFSEFGFYTFGQLTDAEKAPPQFIVDGIVPVGMTFLSSAPKTKKSFLALQLAIAVATGTDFFGHHTSQCDVAYFDLEGSKGRISDRVNNMTLSIPDNVFIANRISKRLADGLVDDLRALHQQCPKIRLIIIDTYSRSRGKVKNGTSNAYDMDVAFLEPIQQMAIDENIAIFFVHHDKKGAGFMADSFERLSGTMGISGSADSVLNLITEGKRWDGKAKLEYNPRDARGGELNLIFDEHRKEWMLDAKPKADIHSSPIACCLINHIPPPHKEGVFCPYDQIFEEAFHYSSSETAGDRVRAEVAVWREQLYKDYRLGIQTGARSNGSRGVRLINLD